MNIDPLIVEEVSSFKNSASFIRSARYGYNSIDPYIAQLKEGSTILEVGGGACILSAQLSKKYPKLNFYTIEPHAEGFEGFDGISHFLSKRYNLNVHFGDFRTFSAPNDDKFDLIFSIDVLEHLPSYEHFIKWCKGQLRNSGKLVTVFPNFGFPFDYHFRVPIFCNKRITGFIFQGKIKRDEASKNCEGLWDSLNFITVKELKALLAKLDFNVRQSTYAFDYMLDQIKSDSSLVERAGVLASMAKFAFNIGILTILRKKIFQNWIPFAVVEAVNRSSDPVDLDAFLN